MLPTKFSWLVVHIPAFKTDLHSNFHLVFPPSLHVFTFIYLYYSYSDNNLDVPLSHLPKRIIHLENIEGDDTKLVLAWNVVDELF